MTKARTGVALDQERNDFNKVHVSTNKKVFSYRTRVDVVAQLLKPNSRVCAALPARKPSFLVFHVADD